MLFYSLGFFSGMCLPNFSQLQFFWATLVQYQFTKKSTIFRHFYPALVQWLAKHIQFQFQFFCAQIFFFQFSVQFQTTLVSKCKPSRPLLIKCTLLYKLWLRCVLQCRTCTCRSNYTKILLSHKPSRKLMRSLKGKGRRTKNQLHPLHTFSRYTIVIILSKFMQHL